ncbi:hypothetical protein TYRP_002572 [Tyrophagus putrescentiae]|nr:hypothetical protein TYRP_002572 [Tyrophagus putrescentiae]
MNYPLRLLISTPTPTSTTTTATVKTTTKVFSDQCFAAFQADANMAPKKKMRRSAKTLNSSLDNKESRPKKTVHFGEEVVVEVEEETNDFPSIDFFIFNDNTTEEEQNCDSETEEEEEEEPDEAIDTTAAETSDDLQQLYAEYRLEVEQLVRCSAAMGNEKRILTLERLVADLLEHNQTLVTSLAEVREESARRVAAMQHRLVGSAGRTEEVMLALASHELLLKKFVGEHCCACCACDLRLMQFRLCHRERCEDGEHLFEEEDEDGYEALSFGQCRTLKNQGPRQWNSILHNTSAWFDSRRRSTNRKRLLPMEDSCAHNLPSQLRFTSFVDQIDDRLETLEAENDEVRRENELLRELNSLLSGRNGPPLTISSHRGESNRLPFTYRVEGVGGDGGGSVASSSSSTSSSSSYANGNGYTKKEKPLPPIHHHHPHHPHQDHQDHHHHLPTLLHDDTESEVEETTTAQLSEHLITFLGECSQRNRALAAEDDSFGNYLHDSLDLRDGCGLFGSLIGSDHGGSRSDSLNSSSHGRTTDNDSGLCSTDLIQTSQTDMNSLMTHASSDGEDEIEELLRSHSTAERLVPKLYSKLLYYLVQRNMLLRQFQQENRARQKCKEELSTLADCVAAGLKDIELNTAVIKQIQLQSDPTTTPHFSTF